MIKNKKEFNKKNNKRKAKKESKRKKIKFNLYRCHPIVKHKNRKPCKELELLKTDINREKIVIEEIPIIFSITKNPSETINFLKRISSYFCIRKDLELEILCNKTEEMDVSALLILCVLIVKGNNYIESLGYKCSLKGDYPKDRKLYDLFRYSGLPKYLNITDDKNDGIVLLSPFETIKNTNKESDRIRIYYEKCLKLNGFKLSTKGQTYIIKQINEIINNAIKHSGYEIIYSGGYYNHSERKGYLSFVSFGNSIYDTLTGDSASKEIKYKIKNYISKQEVNFNKNYDLENCCTVLSLQDRISRYSKPDNDRGTGTVKFIETFFEMGQTASGEKPIMSLLSGNTQIIFDGKYKMKDQIVSNEKVKVIAFNEHNSLYERPDNKYVKKINHKFPGVIINIEFNIDEAYLEKFVRKGKQ